MARRKRNTYITKREIIEWRIRGFFKRLHERVINLIAKICRKYEHLKIRLKSMSKEVRLRRQLENEAFFKELEECGLFDNIKEAEE